MGGSLSSERRDASSGHSRQRRQPLQRVPLLGAVDVDRGDDQAVDAGAAEALDPLGHLGLGPDQRRRLDDLVRHRLESAAAVAVLEAALDLVGDVAEAEAVRQVDVEVGFAAAHAAEVEDQARLDDVLRRLEVAVDRHLQRGADLEVRALPPALGEADLQVLAPGLLEGIDAEEDRDPAVADLRRHLDRFAADRADEDGDLVAQRVEVQLQRLALAAGQRQRVVLALVIDRPLAGDDLPHHFDVLAGASPRLCIRHPVPALGDLGAGGAEAEEEAAAGEFVDRRPGHRRRRGRARRHLQDRRAEVDLLGPRRQPGEHADHVGAVGLGGPDRLEAHPLGGEALLRGFLAGRSEPTVTEVESELQAHSSLTLLNRAMSDGPASSTTSPDQGLSSGEAAARLRKLGPPPESSSRSTASIVAGNVFTLFNAIIGAFFVLDLALGLYADSIFGLIAVVNSYMGIRQELKAKKTLDELAVLVAPRANVVRDGAVVELLASELVPGDIVQ